jgi:hypothetical protein
MKYPYKTEHTEPFELVDLLELQKLLLRPKYPPIHCHPSDAGERVKSHFENVSIRNNIESSPAE